jgi:hypothetical protein
VELLTELHAETQLSDGSGSGNAVGWTMRSLEEAGRILEKNGGRSNCGSWIGFSLRHKVAVAIVTNCGGPSVDRRGRELLKLSIVASFLNKPGTNDGYAKVFPFTEVRFESEQVIVTYDGQTYQWLEIDEIKFEDIGRDSCRQFRTTEMRDKRGDLR